MVNFDIDDLCYQITGDIWFELITKRKLTDRMIEAWEESTGGISLPAFSGGIGDYAGDSGSQITWEILED